MPCNYLGTPEIDNMLLRHFQSGNMEDVRKELGVDLRIVEPKYAGPKLRRWSDGRFENYWGQIRKPIKNTAGTYNESVELPYANFKSVADVEAFRWPCPDWFDFTSLRQQCEEYSEYATVYGGTGNMDVINGAGYGMGVEAVLYGIAMDDPIVYACMEKRFRCCYAISEKALQAGGGIIDILWIGDDYGTQNGLLVSPEKWREQFYPKLKAFCQLGHEYGAKVMLHSCGSTKKIWPDLIEAGVDIYDTIQPEAFGMKPEHLKREFGDKICFHGTISTQKTLPFATPDEVAAEVHDRVDKVGKNGGFILAPSHNIQPDTPIENILSMYKAAGAI